MTPSPLLFGENSFESKSQFSRTETPGVGGVVMAVGYYSAEIFMYGAGAALVNLPANIGQGAFGAIVAVALYTLLKGRIASLKIK